VVVVVVVECTTTRTRCDWWSYFNQWKIDIHIWFNKTTTAKHWICICRWNKHQTECKT